MSDRYAKLPEGNVEDRRNSLVDSLLTQLAYPMRKDWASLQRWGDPPMAFPQIAADFPTGPGGDPGSKLALDAGIEDIKPRKR